MPDSWVTPKHSGFTVAYLRNNSHVFFAVSLVNKHDQYSKSVGRELTKENLEENIEKITSEYTHYNTHTRLGCILVKDIVKVGDVSKILGDHAASKLTMMDFKHAFISEKIAHLVLISTEMALYP